MYISFEQIEMSLKELDVVHPFFGTSFLAFKQLDLKINELRDIDIADQETLLLETYYNPLPQSQYYYVPLRSGGRRDRWVSKSKYPDSGLQKTRTTTFLAAFLHPDKHLWAWEPNYVSWLLSFLHDIKVPTFHLAIWMLRTQDWPSGTQAPDIIDHFFSLFNISKEEQGILFDNIVPQSLFSLPLFQDEPITWKNLKKLTGGPRDEPPDEGGGLEYLELIGVGPAKQMQLSFAPRLNLITGDNGLGKTFLLDCAWWVLSNSWADPDMPAHPRSDSPKPGIGFQISGSPIKPKTIYFDKLAQLWPLLDKNRPVLPGIVIYARVDGSFLVWDPAKHYWITDNLSNITDAIRFTANDIWDGLEGKTQSGRKYAICEGLVRDWITWQTEGTTTFKTFSSVLQKLSPDQEIPLIPSKPVEMARDIRKWPTLKLPYDDVPVALLSAGIKRILSLAYLLVWTWETHKQASKTIQRTPQSKIVFIIDEMEAHLHPRWQRIIVPALLDVVKVLESTLEIQLIIATHSPLVMASIEPIFNDNADRLFTIDLVKKELEVREIPYTKRGSVNSWLTSEVFDLKRAYSIEAEQALINARNEQLVEHPDPEKIREISQRLAEHLPPMDTFWPRWTFFAKKYGVDI